VSELAGGCEDRLSTWGIESLPRASGDGVGFSSCAECSEPLLPFSTAERPDGALLALRSGGGPGGGTLYRERAGGASHRLARGATPFRGGWGQWGGGSRARAAGPSRLMPCGWYFRPPGLEPVAVRCPVDIWDEPPNEYWHADAAEAAGADVWAWHESLAAREGAATEALRVLRAAPGEAGQCAGQRSSATRGGRPGAWATTIALSALAALLGRVW
jgi:hypothetical protein